MDVDIKNTFVVDASFVIAFLLDEHNTEVEAIFKKQVLGDIFFISPSILKYEVGNTLRTKLMRKKIKKGKAQKLYQLFLSMNIKEESIVFSNVLEVALEENLSFYDASYLYLSKYKKVDLLSLDHSLK